MLRSGLWSGQWEESHSEATPSKNHCKVTTIVFNDYTGTHVYTCHCWNEAWEEWIF